MKLKKLNYKFFKKSGAGFTLIELLVVIAIIGILSAVVLVSLGGTRTKAKIAKAQADIKDLYTAISLLEGDTAQWPGHQEIARLCQTNCNNNEICETCANNLNSGFAGIIMDDGANPYPGWNGPYYKGPITNTPLDPWGHQYFFDTDYCVDTALRVVVGSYGPDGISDLANNNCPAGANSADDVVYIISASP